MTDDQTTAQIEALVRRGRAVSADMKMMSEQCIAIKARLEELVPVGWKQDVDGIVASRKPGNRSFDWRAAYDSIDPNQRHLVVRTGFDLVDEKAVRAHVESNRTIDQFMVEPDASKTSIRLS